MKVLLIDDEQSSRFFLARFLRKLGYHVDEASDGIEAVQLCQSSDYNLIISDIKMPGMNGIELLRQLRSMGLQGEVIVYTAFGDVNTAVEALRAGAFDYLLKPLNLRELVTVCEKVVKYQALKKENEYLNRHFEQAVHTETHEVRKELNRWKEAYSKIAGIEPIVFKSQAMKKIFKEALILHKERNITVLIEGETGTGKELIARLIHCGEENNNPECPFVDINCSAVPPALFESELFGYESGAFSGGKSGGQKGKLDIAQGGTLFLDEISEVRVDIQSKLLRVLQEKEYYRIGGLKKHRADIRIITATNRKMEEQMISGEFRRDLYYRISGAHIYVPPLRERREDIIPLASAYLQYFAHKKGKTYSALSTEACELLYAYDWPGNVRELRNLIEWAVLMGRGGELKVDNLSLIRTSTNQEIIKPTSQNKPADWREFVLPPDELPLQKFNSYIIKKAVEMHQGNKTKAARYLGLSVRALSYRIDKE